MKLYNGLEIEGGKWVDWIQADDDQLKIDKWWKLIDAWQRERGDIEQVSLLLSTQALYIAMRLDGTKHKLAEMLALQQAPRANTDREFWMGHCNGNQFEGRELEGDYYRRIAEAHGQDTTGKIYMGSLARYPADPQAWVSGKGDVERLLDQNGWGAEGCVSRQVKKVAEAASCPLAADVLHREVDEIIARTVPAGEEHLVDRVDLAEQVFEARKGAFCNAKFEPEQYGLTEEKASA